MSLLTKATPVLVVDSIEPVLPFWRKVGLTPTTEVPDGAGRLAFVILAAAGVEIMYQTTASVKDDLLKARRPATPTRPETLLCFLSAARGPGG